MATVTDNISTPVIENESSKFPQEIILKIHETMNDERCYLDSVWSSKLIHSQKMVLLYLSGIKNNSVTITNISTNTGLIHTTTQKTIKNLIKNNYIESDDYSKDTDWYTDFTFKLTKKIVEEYLLNIIHYTEFINTKTHM